jgi:D-serine deaminase-like pyridoxal phosphate-dependent protein
MPPVTLPAVETPAILIDLDVVERNAAHMQDKADRHGVALRPHIKTHKIPELALMQLRLGAAGVATAKVSEAEVMAAAGISDIFIANQVVTERKLERLVDLGRRSRVAVGLDSATAARRLSRVCVAAGATVEYLIEIDCGLHRCGVQPGEPAVRLFETVRGLEGLRFKGIFSHAGHAYGSRSHAELEEIARQESLLMAETARQFGNLGSTPEVVSVGATPTVQTWDGHPAITELRPGNYIFNDATQVSLGAATPGDCALTVLATVISRPAAERAVIDAGSKVFSLDRGVHGTEKVSGFGMVLGRNATLERLSEEHGIMSVDPDETLQVGDAVRVIPNHACPVVNLFDGAYGVRGGEVVAEFKIAARGMVQ